MPTMSRQIKHVVTNGSLLHQYTSLSCSVYMYNMISIIQWLLLLLPLMS
jgi:hypothetical protein